MKTYIRLLIVFLSFLLVSSSYSQGENLTAPVNYFVITNNSGMNVELKFSETTESQPPHYWTTLTKVLIPPEETYIVPVEFLPSHEVKVRKLMITMKYECSIAGLFFDINPEEPYWIELTSGCWKEDISVWLNLK